MAESLRHWWTCRDNSAEPSPSWRLRTSSSVRRSRIWSWGLIPFAGWYPSFRRSSTRPHGTPLHPSHRTRLTRRHKRVSHAQSAADRGERSSKQGCVEEVPSRDLCTGSCCRIFVTMSEGLESSQPIRDAIERSATNASTGLLWIENAPVDALSQGDQRSDATRPMSTTARRATLGRPWLTSRQSRMCCT